MAVQQKSVVPISVSAEAMSATHCVVSARQHRVTIDEPALRHGTDKGPTPLETLLAAFAGCTNVILNRIATERGIQISNMKVQVTGHLDRRGIEGSAKVTNVFPEIDLTIECAMRGAPDDLGPVQQALRERCPVSVLLHAAGSTVRETWHISRI